MEPSQPLYCLRTLAVLLFQRRLLVFLQSFDGDRLQSNSCGRVILQDFPQVVLRQAKQVRISDGTHRRRASIPGVAHIENADLAEIRSRPKSGEYCFSVVGDDLQSSTVHYVHLFADFTCARNQFVALRTVAPPSILTEATVRTSGEAKLLPSILSVFRINWRWRFSYLESIHFIFRVES